MDNFAEALAAVKSLKDDGVVDEYAIGGAMALVFWSEPTATFDLDVFVLLQSLGTLISLEPIYRWAKARGYSEKAEHIVVAGVPIQVIPAHGKLAKEAVETAVNLDYDGQSVRVMRPEFLIAISLEGSARTAKRLARVALLMESGNVDHDLLNKLLKRYNLVLPQQ